MHINKTASLIFGLFLWVFLLMPARCPIQAAELTDADRIVQKANQAALYPGADSCGSVHMIITDKLGRTRKRAFNTLRKNCSANNGDQLYLIYFQAPADVRKMTFMVHKHDNPGKDDDRWLYLPSLDLVKRIAAGDKRTSFAGSDFLYEDISGRNIHEDRHTLQEVTDRFYVIKSTPRHPGTVAFDHCLAYIDKETFLPMKQEFFNGQHRIYRVIEATDMAYIDTTEKGTSLKYPVITRSVAKNLETGSRSEMTFSRVRFNTGVEDTLFTERYLRRPPRRILR